MEGKVKFYNPMKRFGFILGDDGKEYFVHKSGLKAGTFLKENDTVKFDPAESERGLQAQNVEKTGEGAPSPRNQGNAPAEDGAEESSEDEYSDDSE